MTPEAESKTKPRRRWFQFSLASLLVLVTVICIVLGFYVNPVLRHNRAIEFVQQEWHFVRPGYSCKVDWSTGRPILNAGRPIGNWFERLFGENTAIDITQLSLDDNTNVDEEGLKHLSAMTELHSLSLSCSSITDGDMETICSLTQLDKFGIACPQITDVGLRSVRRLSHLTRFSIGNNEKITDEGLANLASLHNLRELYLYHVSGVSGAGLAHLESLHNLRELRLFHVSGVTDDVLLRLASLRSLRILQLHNVPSVTDAGLAHLTSLHNLKELELYNAPGSTVAGRERLKRALPDCRFRYSFPGERRTVVK